MPKKRRPPKPTGFADQLRQVIGGRGLTGYAVAMSAGVAPSVVARFLNRERGLTLETFDAIAGALGLRLVETGRGKVRPSKVPRPSVRVVVPEEEASGKDGPAEIATAEVDWDPIVEPEAASEVTY